MKFVINSQLMSQENKLLRTRSHAVKGLNFQVINRLDHYNYAFMITLPSKRIVSEKIDTT